MTERDPFQESLDDHLVRIRKIVRRVARDESDLDDLAQECCVRILEKEQLWRPQETPFAHWLSRVARNFALNRARDRSRRKEASVEDPDLYPAPAAPVEEEIVSEEQIRKVMEQFRHLTPGQRRVLHMRYFDGKRTGEIARELGISSEAVSMQLGRALDRLRRRMGAGALLVWIFTFGWLRESKAAASGSAAAATAMGGAAMKAKMIAAAGILGTASFGYQTYDSKQEACRERERLQNEITKSRAASEKADRTIASLKQEKDAALAAKRDAEMTVALAQRVEPATTPGGSHESAPLNSKVKPDHFLTRQAAGLRDAFKPEAVANLREIYLISCQAKHFRLFKEWGLDKRQIQSVVENLTDQGFNRLTLYAMALDPSMPMEDVIQRATETEDKYLADLSTILTRSQIGLLEQAAGSSVDDKIDFDLQSISLTFDLREQLKTVIHQETQETQQNQPVALTAFRVLYDAIPPKANDLKNTLYQARTLLNRPTRDGVLAPMNDLDNRIVERARAFLTPDQFSKFERYQRKGVKHNAPE